MRPLSLRLGLAAALLVAGTSGPGARALQAQVAPPVDSAAPPAHGGAHHEAPPSRARAWAVGARAVGLVTRADPAFQDRAYTEGYLTQPMLMARLALPRAGAALSVSLNFEGLTLERGELNAGIYGEGYVDRRHPHTLVHEAIVSVGRRWRPGAAHGDGAHGRDTTAGVAWSLSGGKGFVPFGTDDPMARPFVKFPVNHHLSQLLERWVATAGVRTRAVMLEGALFNGDEPTGPYAWPSGRRFADSWAARATLYPVEGVELSASTADVVSPEFRTGGGLDQRKHNVAARLERAGPRGTRLYALVEGARTDDRSRGRRAYRYESVLGEGAVARGPWTAALRLERTTRPEEERLLDPFRSPRPHAESSIIGLTRWHLATLAVAREVAVGRRLRVEPLVEVTWAHAAERVRPAVFEPARFYGARGQWSLSAGVRMTGGMRHGRMGRYGVAALDADASHGPS